MGLQRWGGSYVDHKTKSQTNTHRKTKRQRDKKTNTMKWALRFGHYCSDGTSFISVTAGSSCRVPPKPVSQMLQLQIQSQIQIQIQIFIQLQIRTQHTHTQMLYWQFNCKNKYKYSLPHKNADFFNMEIFFLTNLTKQTI